MTIEVISSLVTIFGAVRGIYNWVTGATVTNQIKNVENKINRIADNIYFLEKNEISYTGESSIASQPFEYKKHIEELSTVQKVFDSSIILTNPIGIPKNMANVISSNPDELLYDIKPILSIKDVITSYDDKTIIPVSFYKWGQQFVGHTKRGILFDKFHLDYSPIFTTNNQNSEYKNVIRSNVIDRRYFCGVCGKPADNSNGSFCKKCGVYIHKKCDKEVLKKKRFNIMLIDFSNADYYYACPICNSIIRIYKSR